MLIFGTCTASIVRIASMRVREIKRWGAEPMKFLEEHESDMA
jgi:hypothetical protein